MIQIENQTVSGIPFLHIVKEENRHRAVPLVIFIHGFTSAKEHNLHIAYLLAEKGFRAVLPEALHHGERGEEMAVEELAGHFGISSSTRLKRSAYLKTILKKRA